MAHYYPEFYCALERWAEACYCLLEASLESRVYLREGPLWVLDPDGNLVLTPSQFCWDWSLKDQLIALPEWPSVTQISERSPEIQRHFGTIVWDGSFGRRWELPDVARMLLPTFYLGPDRRGWLLEPFSRFAENYERFENFLRAEKLRNIRLTPLFGLSIEQEELELQPDITIRRMTQSELAAAMNSPLLSAPFGKEQSFIGASDYHCLALVAERLEEKVIGEGHSRGPRVQERFEEDRFREEDLIAALSLLGAEETRTFGSMECTDWPDAYGFVFGRSSPSSVDMMVSSTLTSAQTGELQRIWKALHRAGRTTNEALHLAMIRLSHANARSRSVDQILDIMIAAEALYLGSDNANSRGELEFRLSLYAAKWADCTELKLTQREVFATMKMAYNARSIVAHGAIPKAKDLKVQRQAITLEELLVRTKEIVRQGIRKALDSASSSTTGKLSIDWDSLLLD